MDLFFTILKFAGVFVSGFGAIIAAIPDSRRGKRSEKSKLKQVWHKLSTKQSGLYIAIIGFLVAMLSQFVETIKSSKESKDVQAKYEEQMKVATNSLAKLEEETRRSKEGLQHLERLATRLEKAEMSVTVILEPDSLSWSNLLSEIAAENPRFETQVFSNTIVWINEAGKPDTNQTAYSNSDNSPAYAKNIIGFAPRTNEAGQVAYWDVRLIQKPGPPPKKLPTDYPSLLASSAMSSSLKSIITNLVTHVVIFTGTPGRDMPKLVNQDAILLRAAKAQFLPPDNYLAPDSTNYARFNATTNWALSLEYAFSFQITNASLVGFPLSLPDLGFKKGVLVLRNFPMSMFSRVTCTNLVFNFGHSIVPVSGGAPWTREDSPGFDWHFVTTQFGRHPLPVLSFDIPVMSFQFPDEDTLFRRNQKN